MPLFGPPNVERLKAKKDVKGLIKALRDKKDANVRRGAARALGGIGDARAVAPLIEALKDVDESVREAAAGVLIAQRWQPDKSEAGVIYWIQKGKNDKNQTARQSAIKVLGQIGELAVEPLIAQLENEAWTASSNAAAALGLIGDPRAVEPLIVTLAAHDDPKSVLHSAAVKALGQIGDARAVEPLIDALRNRTDRVHEGAVKALGALGGVAVEPLVAVLKAKSSIVRAAAVGALGQTGDPRAVEPLITALEDGSSYVRRTAVEALDHIGWKPDLGKTGARYWIGKGDYDECVAMGAVCVEPLIALFKDPAAGVRKCAVGALGQLGAPAVEPLVAALKDGDYFVRQSAAEALGIIRDRGAVEPLIAVLKDENGDVREQAAEALGQIGDTRAVEPLIAVLKDENVDVRERAATTLVMMYKTDGFGEQAKKAILAQANEIAKLDRASHHDHSDESWGGCFGDANHIDRDSVDPGFHADFSL